VAYLAVVGLRLTFSRRNVLNWETDDSTCYNSYHLQRAVFATYFTLDCMARFDTLKGETLLEVVPTTEGTGLRFSTVTAGVYGAISGTPAHQLVGRYITGVRHVEGELLELDFLGNGQMKIDLRQRQPEAIAVVYADGRQIVG
jgi:hypothetical protein